MTPGKTRKEALSVLRATRRMMIGSSWSRKLKRQDLPARRRAADALLNIGSAIDTIELAELESIAGAMEGNEAAIRSGLDSLRKSIEGTAKVASVLGAVEKLLALGHRISPLLI